MKLTSSRFGLPCVLLSTLILLPPSNVWNYRCVTFWKVCRTDLWIGNVMHFFTNRDLAWIEQLQRHWRRYYIAELTRLTTGGVQAGCD